MHRLEKKKKERKITLSLIMFKLSQKTSFYRRDVVKKEGEDFLLFFQTKQRSQWLTRRLCVSLKYYCNHFYLFVVRLFCLLIYYLVLHGEGIALISFLVRFYVVDFFLLLNISLNTSPPSINASVTTDSKRTSAGVTIIVHCPLLLTHRSKVHLVPLVHTSKLPPPLLTHMIKHLPVLLSHTPAHPLP